jgi:hypothetical protein
VIYSHAVRALLESRALLVKMKRETRPQRDQDPQAAYEGSGSNVAVLTGRDGKLLVDAGITGSRPRITEGLTRSAPCITRFRTARSA